MHWQGYSNTEIAKVINRSGAVVTRKCGGSIPHFTYIFNLGGKEVYINSIRELRQLYGYSENTNVRLIKEFRGKYEKVNLRWGEVPEKAYYFTKEGFFIKDGVDSYNRPRCQTAYSIEAEAWKR